MAETPMSDASYKTMLLTQLDQAKKNTLDLKSATFQVTDKTPVARPL